MPKHENLPAGEKYCGKEEQFRLRSNFSLLQYFHYISNFKSPITYEFFKCGCLNYFPQFCKSDMSRYGYLEVFGDSLGIRNSESRLYFVRRFKILLNVCAGRTVVRRHKRYFSKNLHHGRSENTFVLKFGLQHKT